MRSRIVTEHVYPPVPTRAWDWAAYRDGNEEGLTGRGATEAAAINDLLRMEIDEECAIEDLRGEPDWDAMRDMRDDR